MKTFEEILNSGVINIAEFENYRIEQKKTGEKKTKKLLPYFIAGFILLSIIFTLLGLIILIPVLLIVGIIVLLTMRNINYGNFVETFQEGIIKKIMHSFDSSFEYKPYEWIPEHEFKASNFMPNCDSYRGEDYFYGKYENIPIQISQISCAKKMTTSRTLCYFEGIFITAEFKQPFEGRTTILPDELVKHMNDNLGLKMYQNPNIRNDVRVRFDDVEFNKNLGVFTNNADEAKNRIIKGNLINYLLELNKMSKRGVYFSCSEQKFYLGLNNSSNIFQIDIKNQINEENLKKYYSEILSILNNIRTIYSILEENTADIKS